MRLFLWSRGQQIVTFCFSESFWDSSAFETDTDLPSGWMRVRDTSGTYYWHIPTGTTQWEPPSPLGKVGDSMMSSTMSLETTPCEEPDVSLAACFFPCGLMRFKSGNADFCPRIFQESWAQLSSTDEGAGEMDQWKVNIWVSAAVIWFKIPTHLWNGCMWLSRKYIYPLTCIWWNF